MSAAFPVLKSFAAILDSDSNRYSPLHSERTAAISRITRFYDITPAQAEIIANLLRYYPMEVSESRLTGIPARWKEDSANIVVDLIQRGFIIVHPRPASPCDSYRVSDKAHEAFEKNLPFGLSTFVNCVQELKDAPLGKLFRNNWLDSFTLSLSQESNSKFGKAVDALGIKALSEDSQLAFWVIVRHFVHNFLSPLAYRNGEDILADIDYSQTQLKANIGILVKQGLVHTLPIEPLEDTKDTDRFVLAPKVAGLLFHGREELIKYDEISKYANVIKVSEITRKPLFFSDETQEEVDHLRVMLSEEGFERACRILKGQQRNPAIQSLLWGPPGTGKTEVVKQIALESGRDIILFDLAKTTASAWGATEKFYRALFRAYNYMAELSVRVPILLMNEADSVLSKRLGSIERAIDKSENAISNILLQEFEDMSGILLATTNLIDNLDEAFDRRFLFKTRMPKPDASARFHIWHSAIPTLTDEEVRILAGGFEMSGAQIANVVAKRSLAELYYDGDRGLPFIEKLCYDELATESRNGSRRPKIGF